jgi:biopolymer transport protein ExbD
MKRKAHGRRLDPAANPGFQIAPMIDVVFVILLFFMVKAGDIQTEMAHVTQLPSGPYRGCSVQMPDEIAITVAEDGQVYLNDDPLDAPDSESLPQLAENLATLRRSADYLKAEVLVIVQAEEQARYQRVIDVMDALHRAQISGVTFASIAD